MEDRKITFGKYKGEPIKKLILEHIGYIMWCLSNIDWFELNDEEQPVYDALALANEKYGIEMEFSHEEMMSHVKNKDMETPFIVCKDGTVCYNIEEDSENPIIKSILAYKVLNGRRYNTRCSCTADLGGILHSAAKMGFGNSDNYSWYDDDDDLLSQEEFMGW